MTTLLRHPGLSADETRAARNAERALSLMGMDPPEHTRLRGLVARAFTPRRLEDLRGVTQAIADELLDGMAGRGKTVDLIEAFAYPLPVRVICALLGVPPADEPLFTEWSRGMARSVDPVVLRTPEIETTIKAAQHGLAAYIADRLAERRRAPGDDLLSALAAVDVDGDSITAREIVALAQLLLFAGHETTVNLIGNAVLALLGAPDQLALLRQSPELTGAAVDEFLRFDSPAQVTLRIVSEDTELVGVPVKAGDEIMLILAAANHDAAVFADLHRLDVTRDARRHVAFGSGIHHCLGATLARMEGEVALNTLLQRFSGIELAGLPTRLPTFTLRGLDTLPVALRS
ncbi:MAG: cytochrome P450 [Reyranella sp.]|uniref:cytochrome P450 n=1 Tax=Reyranella sp. TaxID=1929291 RepID=UPI003D0F2197